MLRGRLALVTGYLCLAYLLGLTPTPAAAKPCTKDILRKVKFLISKAPHLKSLNCRLYTPTSEDYQNCPGSSLNCSAQEIDVLLEEWEPAVQGIRGYKLKPKLEQIAEALKQSETECRRCELFNVQEAEMFLQDLQMNLQSMNMVYKFTC